MKKKEIAVYAVAAFVYSIPLQIFVDWVSGCDISETPLWAYLFGACVFTLLMTAFKIFFDRKKHRE